MTTYYVDSAAGSNTAPYDTWAKAALSLETIAAIDAAGDTVYVASTHNETKASAWLSNWAGTLTNPTRIICADKTSGAPPATIATGATVTTTGNSGITVNSGAGIVYFYGVTFIAGSAASGTASITCNNGGLFEQCSFQLASTGVASAITVNASRWRNCTVKFAAAAQIITPVNGFLWSGGSLLAGGTSPTSLMGGAASITVENIDLSNAAAGINLSSGGNLFTHRLRKIKLPASWSGQLTGAVGWASLHELINGDYAGTNYVYHRQTQFGDIYHETTLVRTGGASDGTTPISLKMVSLAASGVFPVGALVSGEVEIWNDTVGSAITVTKEFVHDSATALKNNEIWIEVRYPKNTGDPLGEVASSAMASVLATPANVTSSSATWTTTGMSNPNKQKMAVTFTPQMKGPIYAIVFLAKASYTVYVDPKLTLS